MIRVSFLVVDFLVSHQPRRSTLLIESLRWSLFTNELYKYFPSNWLSLAPFKFNQVFLSQLFNCFVEPAILWTCCATQFLQDHIYLQKKHNKKRYFTTWLLKKLVKVQQETTFAETREYRRHEHATSEQRIRAPFHYWSDTKNKCDTVCNSKTLETWVKTIRNIKSKNKWIKLAALWTVSFRSIGNADLT